MNMWTWVLLSGLIGCTDAGNGACDDPVCRAERVERAFHTSPEKLQEALRVIADPVEQIALVRRFVGSSDLDRFCAQIPADMATISHECGRMLVRPHLHTAPPSRREIDRAARVGSGPGWPELRAAGAWVNPWASTPPILVECPHPSLQDTCQHQAALRAAAAGDAPGVAGACMAVPVGRWRDECFFDAVKTVAVSWDVARITPAVSLCLATSPDWIDLCLERAVTNRNGKAHDAHVPRLTDPDGPVWAAMRQRAEAARRALQSTDPELAEATVSRLWAQVLGLSAAKTPSLPELASDHLPLAALPHFRAAVAWQQWMRGGEGGPASRSGIPAAPPEIRAWATDEAGEEMIPAVHYFYGDRRAVVDDPSTDAFICLLEAIARAPRRAAGLDILRSAADHDDTTVQWTAVRLMARMAQPDAVPPGEVTAPTPEDIAGAQHWTEIRRTIARAITR